MRVDDRTERQSEREADARYAPGIPVDDEKCPAPFDHGQFLDYLSVRFGVSEKVYEPLKVLLSVSGISASELLGKDFPGEKNRKDIMQYERAKLAVLVRQMSTLNRKWRSQVLLAKPSMSAVLGSYAPGSTCKNDNDEMLRYYLSELKSGIPSSRLACARPLLEDASPGRLEGGHFEGRIAGVTRHVADFITARQRQLLVRQNRQRGWRHPRDGFAFWPAHVSPAYGAEEAIKAARAEFVTLTETLPASAHNDMARIRLLKNFFLDSEACYWAEMHALYTASQRDLPDALGRLDLRVKRHEITDAVAQAFGVDASSLPDFLVEQAQCLVWLYGVKHDPFGSGDTSSHRQTYFRQLKQPHYLALAAAILYHLCITASAVRIEVPGETHKNVRVYRAFLDALAAAGITLAATAELGEIQAKAVLSCMDTKALSHMVSLFSLAANADDAEAPFLRMDYLAEHARMKIQRCALLAELPKMLKTYSCTTAFELMGMYISVLKAQSHNPLMEITAATDWCQTA
ncbi:MAG: hypothetical protein V7772_00865 [Pseudomonas profundi]|uniref:hypothetical protein n=1 Tax=Pseudomonas profundi TaxID=1981513 RepID=UPI003002439D